MKRRTHGEGSIYPVKGGWMAQVSRGSGLNRRYERRQRRTKAEARIALRELVGDREAGVHRSREPLGDYLKRWVEDLRNVKPTTQHGYRVAVDYHLIPTLGHIRLSDLTPSDVEDALHALAGRMSAKHLRNIHAVLRKALADGMRRGLVHRNVASREYVASPRVPDKEPEAFTTAEVTALLAAANGTDIEVPLRLSLATGLRIGELLGLAWEDIDYDAHRLHVRYELVRRDGQYSREELKNGSRSRRSLPLSDQVAALMQRHEQSVKDLGLLPIKTGPVFTTKEGQPKNGTVLYHRLQEIEDQAGVRRLPWKNLRTTFASRMFEAGVSDRQIADWLGHRRTKTTHAHYLDTTNGAQDRALEASERIAGL